MPARPSSSAFSSKSPPPPRRVQCVSPWTQASHTVSKVIYSADTALHLAILSVDNWLSCFKSYHFQDVFLGSCQELALLT